jgi:pyruvate/2-oxoglutarate dehydrogenase complex dihydrolipoamide acyltransferase (E2) component
VRLTVKMPRVGDTVDEVTIVEWAKAIGDAVAAGEVLLHVETSKATLEVPAPVGGTLIEILLPVDADVRTGTPIAVIEGNV